MFSDKAMHSGALIARKLDMSPKMVNKLKQRIKKNGTLIPRKRGSRRKVTEKMISFLKTWLKLDGNVGKSFKYAYGALLEEFGQQGDGGI
jgi:transposase